MSNSSSPAACIIKQTIRGNYRAKCPPLIVFKPKTETTIQRVARRLQLVVQNGGTVFVQQAVNYLGRVEGQNGGSGAPPRN
jgi:hypothetical protein